MALVPFEPFRHMERWKRDLDRLFNEGIPGAFGFQQEFGGPRMDVYETETHVIAHCEIPGLEKQEDVDIRVEPNMLTLSGTIHRVNETNEDQFHRKERYTGRFHRAISLPAEVLAEGTTASYRNGILEVIMPKAKKDEQRRIDVQFH